MEADTFKGTHITSNHSDGRIHRAKLALGALTIFSTAQFFPARDGSWLMVDWIRMSGGLWSWYVAEGI